MTSSRYDRSARTAGSAREEREGVANEVAERLGLDARAEGRDRPLGLCRTEPHPRERALEELALAGDRRRRRRRAGRSWGRGGRDDELVLELEDDALRRLLADAWDRREARRLAPRDGRRELARRERAQDRCADLRADV